MFPYVTFSRGAFARLPSLPMSATEEPGHTSRTRGGYVPGMFRGIEYVDAFADILRVPRKAIPLIVPLSLPCRSRGCPFNAILGNGNHCPTHQRSWYPLIGERGLDLLGPEFLKSHGHFRGCECGHADIFQIRTPSLSLNPGRRQSLRSLYIGEGDEVQNESRGRDLPVSLALLLMTS